MRRVVDALCGLCNFSNVTDWTKTLPCCSLNNILSRSSAENWPRGFSIKHIWFFDQSSCDQTISNMLWVGFGVQENSSILNAYQSTSPFRQNSFQVQGKISLWNIWEIVRYRTNVRIGRSNMLDRGVSFCLKCNFGWCDVTNPQNLWNTSVCFYVDFVWHLWLHWIIKFSDSTCVGKRAGTIQIVKVHQLWFWKFDPKNKTVLSI